MKGIVDRFEGFSVNVHTRIATARHRMKLTEAQFGKAVGVSRGSVQHWERGSNAPNRARQIVVAAFMKITVADLMYDSDSGPALAMAARQVVRHEKCLQLEPDWMDTDPGLTIVNAPWPFKNVTPAQFDALSEVLNRLLKYWFRIGNLLDSRVPNPLEDSKKSLVARSTRSKIVG